MTKKENRARFKAGMKLASSAYRYIKKRTQLEDWREDAGDISWRDVWYHIVSMALRGKINKVIARARTFWQKIGLSTPDITYEMV